MEYISRLNDKVTNGGVTDKGKLTSAEWNAFINDLISELNKRIVSVILNGETKTPTNGVVNLGTIQIDIDSALSLSSNNPVRNSTLTAVINALQTGKADASDLQAITTALAALQASVQGKASVTDLQQAVAQLNALQTSVNTKIGYQVLENGKIRSYDHEGGTLICEVTLSGTNYGITLATTTQSNFVVMSDDTPVFINATPTTQAGEIGMPMTDYAEDYLWELKVKNGSSSEFTTRASGSCAYGGTININVRNYLTLGTGDKATTLKLEVTGADSNAVKSLTFNIGVTTLALISNFSWHNAWYEGERFFIDRLTILGNLGKTVHVKIDNDDNQEYTQFITASVTYDTAPYTFVLPADAFPETEGMDKTGIHTLELWMTSGEIETTHYHYNIMCIATEDVSTAQLVCINELMPAAVNYEEQTLFKFVVHGGNTASITITVADGETTHIIAVNELSVIADQQQEYVLALEVESENMNMTMSIDVASGESGQAVTIPVDNTHSYAAVSGAQVYVNAAYRSNSSADRESIINEAPNAPVSEFEATWENFAWAGDGWSYDPDHNRCLAVLAGSTVEVPGITVTKAGTQSMTYEFKFRVSNIADYDTPILSLMDTEEYNPNTTNGIILFPTKIQVLGSTARNLVGQSVNLYEDSILHVMIVFQRRYADTIYNLCHIYVNGIRQAVFLYEGGISFGNGYLRIGQESSDFYLYMMRIYEQIDNLGLTGVLEDSGVLTNILNQLGRGSSEMDRATMREHNNILDSGNISYEMAKAAGYNTMVVEMQNNASLPDYAHQNGGKSTLWLEYADHPTWNVRIENAPIDGQGTTSKKYYRWNLRWKLKDAAIWTYADGTTTTKKGWFDGQGNHPKVAKITAKKNIASSMQGHKMGACAMYDELYEALGLKTKASIGVPSTGRVAVYQYPFLGFQKLAEGVYRFIGLYTCGPDKGDSGTFGYNNETFLSIEGPNHAPLATRFLHPWVDVDYDQEEETLTFGGEEGWDCDACPYETATVDDPAENAQNKADVMNLYTSEWKPAYEIAYFCSPFLRSLSEIGLTLAQLNANVVYWRAQNNILGTRKNEVLTLYDASYNLIYYRNKTQQYEVLSGHNVVSYLNGYLETNSPTTAQLIAARKAKFIAEMENYWDLDSCLYHEAYNELIGAKDNHAKNTYPFKLIPLAQGGRWSWREDDLDSILATDNNGRSTAHYGIEVGDLTGEGVDIFQGSSSVFWTLIIECFSDSIGVMLGRMLGALQSKAQAMGIQGDNLHQAVFNMFAYYFWTRAAKYFPIMAYAKDSKYSYVDVWMIGVDAGAPDRTYNSVFPLDQALGTQLEAEKQWVERRIANICSKYSLGGFTGSSNDGYGSLEFTPAVAFTFNIIPAIDLYPCGNLGGGTNIKGGRTLAGAVCQILTRSDGQTTFYIKALDWLTDLGDLSGLQLTSRAGGGDISFSVISKRLRRLKVGDAVAENVLFNAQNLSVSGESFEVIDARNVATLNTAVSLVNCPRLKKAYFDGSGALSLILPSGSKVNYVSFPSTLNALVLDQLPLLTSEDMILPIGALMTIRSFYYNKCGLDGFSVLRRILNTEGNSLRFITLIWDGVYEATAEDIDMLYAIKDAFDNTGSEETGYGYTTFEGGSVGTSMAGTHANLQGTLHVSGFYYNDIFEAVQAAFPNITFLCDESPYIRFEDAEVERICSVTWGNYKEVITVDNGDDTVTVTTNFVRMRNTTVASRTNIPEESGTRAKTESDVAGTVKVKQGITLAQAALVSSIGTAFRDNTKIEVVKELKYFSKVKTIDYNNRFNGCSKLRVIYIPATITTLGNNIFSDTALKVVVMESETLPSYESQVFRNVPRNGTVYVPKGCVSNYSAWASNTAYRPGYYGWTITDEEYVTQ